MSYLTDTEKRLLFSALTREKEVCKKIDGEKIDDGTYKKLLSIIENLERKFYYNRFEQDIYEKAYKEGQDKGFSDGEFIGRNKAIDEFAERLRLDCLDNCYHEAHMFQILKVARELKKNS